MWNGRRTFLLGLPGAPECEAVVELRSRQLQNLELSSNFAPGPRQGAPECEAVVELRSRELQNVKLSSNFAPPEPLQGLSRASPEPQEPPLVLKRDVTEPDSNPQADRQQKTIP